MSNERIIRTAYELAEKVDVKGWTQSFTPDGTFTDMSIGVTYRGPDGPTGLGKTVEVYAKAFPDMHRELYRFFSIGDVVVVELALQGTHQGPLTTPMGIHQRRPRASALRQQTRLRSPLRCRRVRHVSDHHGATNAPTLMIAGKAARLIVASM
jgi:hypothetical protein